MERAKHGLALVDWRREPARAELSDEGLRCGHEGPRVREQRLDDRLVVGRRERGERGKLAFRPR
jgi:hypothetical protein